MATDQQTDNAINRVAAGTGNRDDIALAKRASKQAGERGNRATAALATSGDD